MPPPKVSRASVLQAARDLAAEEGLDRLSLRNLASRLGVTAPALYAHVSSKDDLLRAMAEAEFAALMERFEAVTEADPLDRIRALCRVYVAYARESPERFGLMFRFPPELGAGAPTGVELPAATKVFAAAASATEEAIAGGRLAPRDPLVASLSLWTAAHGLAQVLNLGFDFPAEIEDQLVDAVIESMLAGLAQPET